MSKQPAFWDASALVPICVHEIRTRRAQSLLHRFVPVVWWGSAVEVHSAIARLYRAGTLSDVNKTGALSRLDVLKSGWKEILPSDRLRDLATRILDTYELRAADSLQLAAALTWCQQRPAKRTFISADQRLSQSAATAGFSVLQLV